MFIPRVFTESLFGPLVGVPAAARDRTGGAAFDRDIRGGEPGDPHGEGKR